MGDETEVRGFGLPPLKVAGAFMRYDGALFTPEEQALLAADKVRRDRRNKRRRELYAEQRSSMMGY